MANVSALRLVQQLAQKALSLKKSAVLVGYSQSYAIYVHENLEAVHPVGQAKFLEQPAREHAKEISETIQRGLKRGLSTEQSLLLGGLQLQAFSQRLCPVATGALRASAFTEVVDA